jgi:hypothetical protein
MGQLSLADALSLFEMLAARDPQRFERAARALVAMVHGRPLAIAPGARVGGGGTVGHGA